MERPDVAVVYGRRRERNRNATVYNRLADLEWDMPIGEVKACGGDAMILAEAFRRVDGYNPAIIAAEDDEALFADPCGGVGGTAYRRRDDAARHGR